MKTLERDNFNSFRPDFPHVATYWIGSSSNKMCFNRGIYQKKFNSHFFFYLKIYNTFTIVEKKKKNLKWPYVAISTLDFVVLHCRYIKTNRLPALNNIANKRMSLVQYFFCIKVFSYKILPSQLVLQTAHVLKSQRLNVTHNTKLDPV